MLRKGEEKNNLPAPCQPFFTILSSLREKHTAFFFFNFFVAKVAIVLKYI